MGNLKFFDSTLRDGSHAIAHQLSVDNIKQYCKAADNSGMYTIIVGHGNGLGASSLQVGMSAISDDEMIGAARSELKKTKLGAFLIPGFGTIRDDLSKAIDAGVDLVCVAAHCTEADVTKQHIEYVRQHNKEAYGILMMYHMASPQRILVEAKKMKEYGAQGVILMDSAGASTPDMVRDTINILSNNLDIDIGFHAHNNLSLAVSNTYLAINSGATIVDGTTRGFGAGAGNCQLEVLVAFLQKLKIETGIDLYKLMDISEGIVKNIMQKPQEINDISLISGIAGVFSSFAPHVKKASERFQVDPRDIFIELGRRRVVGGQEDCIIDIAMNLAQNKREDNLSYQLESLL